MALYLLFPQDQIKKTRPVNICDYERKQDSPWKKGLKGWDEREMQADGCSTEDKNSPIMAMG